MTLSAENRPFIALPFVVVWRGSGFLLQAGAGANCTGSLGRTPLMSMCASPNGEIATVLLFLLEKGADPAAVGTSMYTPLHVAALHNRLNFIDIRSAKAPDTLNRWTARPGETPLCLACSKGCEGTVSLLRAAGAKQKMPIESRHMCPLATAMRQGHTGVMRLIVEEGLEAVGAIAMLRSSIGFIIQDRRAKMLKVLLEAYMKKAKQIVLPRIFLLRDATGLGCRAAVDVLLRSGADEAALDSRGCLARNTIGTALGPEELPMDRGEHFAIHRMLRQAAVYRAWLWLWPVDDAGVGTGDVDGDDSSHGPVSRCLSGVRVLFFRPEGRKLPFGRLFGRYAEKK